MKLNHTNIEEKLTEAIKSRNIKGFRFDNTKYWKRYYRNKNKKHDVEREKKYALFVKNYLGVGAKVLDVASGYGFLPVELKKIGMDVTCLDKYKGMMKLAKKYFKANEMEIEVHQGDAVSMPFEDHLFDGITAISILEHFPLSEVDDVLKEFHRVLKQDGLLLVHMPIKSVPTIFRKWCKMHIKRDLPRWACDDDGDVTHRIWLTGNEYFWLIKNGGFEIEYVAFNFIRSNEKNWFIIVTNQIMKLMFNRFYKVNNGLSLRLKLLSMLATSVAFVCKDKI